jgi:homoserine O-acetyltransferase
MQRVMPAVARPAPAASPDHRLRLPAPLPLDCGLALDGVEIAFTDTGPRDAPAILVCHALTGDQHVATSHPLTAKPGWWVRMVGEGRAVDTARYRVLCANVMGGCMGTTGPGSPDPATGRPWGARFPVITIADMVRAQARWLDALGVGGLHAVVGGSMGGMQALAWGAIYPGRVERVAAIATAARHSAQNIAFHEVGRQAIMADPNWQDGAYAPDQPPARGLAVARMAAHITYLSEAALTAKFGRRLQAREAMSFSFDADFQVESYLRHQGASFVDRFDANSYLTITRAMDYFDLGEPHGGRLADAFAGASAAGTRFCITSFDSDWLYPTAESRHIVRALMAAGAGVSFVELSAPHGHDSFLLDVPALAEVVAGFIGA